MNIALEYEALIQWIANETDASDALLHVHAGMLVLLLARVVTRRSLATPIPFSVVCLAAFANEIMDRVSHGSWRWMDTSLDVLNTLLWPFALMIGLRVRRLREDRRTSGSAAQDGSPG